MKKILVLAALAFALVAGTAAVMTVPSQPAMADGGGNCRHHDRSATDQREGKSDVTMSANLPWGVCREQA
jgi:hypothetical protein